MELRQWLWRRHSPHHCLSPQGSHASPGVLFEALVGHCEVEQQGQGWGRRDRGGAGGTWVGKGAGGRRVCSNKTPNSGADLLHAGLHFANARCQTS